MKDSPRAEGAEDATDGLFDSLRQLIVQSSDAVRKVFIAEGDQTSEAGVC